VVERVTPCHPQRDGTGLESGISFAVSESRIGVWDKRRKNAGDLRKESQPQEVEPLSDTDKRNAQILLTLQEVDLRMLRLHKRLDELPQRPKILEVRKKIQEVETKVAQVDHMRHEVNRVVKLLQDEENLNKQHMAEAQANLDRSTDYRETTSLAHELELLAKRADKIEQDSLEQLEKLDKVNNVGAQASATIAALQREEQTITTSYQSEGGALHQELADLQKSHVELLDSLDSVLKTRYEKAAKTKGGVGAAHLTGAQCSGCHVTLSEGQLANLKAGPLIGACPNCDRMLVVS
jgi:predicted  nucleic acid-binding Zn-ribbon protein